MTKPTRFGSSIALIGGRLGVVDLGDSAPPSPDCCAVGETPPDRALGDNGGYVSMLGGGGAIAFVQQGVLENNGVNATVAVTLGAAPTATNTLVAVLRERANTPSVATFPTGWTQQESFIGVAFDGGVTTIWTKPVGTGESATTTVTKHRGVEARLFIAEFSGVSFDLSESASAVGVATNLSAGPITPTGTNVLLVAAFDQSARTATYTPAGTWTEIDDDNSDSGSGPSSTVGYRIITSASGSYTVAVTSTESDNYGWGIVGFVGQEPDWVIPAPLTNDGDDATYEDINGGTEVLRADLGNLFRIANSHLVIGCQNAGSKTYTITGATLPDMSDGVVLATTTFTGTGGYTAQDVEFGWEPTVEYQYFQLDGTAEDRYVYTWELSEADPGEVYVTDPTTSDVVPIQVALDNIYAAGGALVIPTAASYKRTSGNYTTSSTTMTSVDGTNMALTITTQARRVMIGFVGTALHSSTSSISFDVDIDGTLQGSAVAGGQGGLTQMRSATASRQFDVSFTYLSSVLSAGSHTFTLKWATPGATATLYGTTGAGEAYAQFWVSETLHTA